MLALTLDQAFQVRVLDAQFRIPGKPGRRDGPARQVKMSRIE
jgi:hypothetical protein